MAAKPEDSPLTQRGLNFEMLMWLFTRLSRAGDVRAWCSSP